MPYGTPQMSDDYQVYRVQINTGDNYSAISFAAAISPSSTRTAPEIFQEFVNLLGTKYPDMTCNLETYMVKACTPDVV